MGNVDLCEYEMEVSSLGPNVGKVQDRVAPKEWLKALQVHIPCGKKRYEACAKCRKPFYLIHQSALVTGMPAHEKSANLTRYCSLYCAKDFCAHCFKAMPDVDRRNETEENCVKSEYFEVVLPEKLVRATRNVMYLGRDETRKVDDLLDDDLREPVDDACMISFLKRVFYFDSGNMSSEHMVRMFKEHGENVLRDSPEVQKFYRDSTTLDWAHMTCPPMTCPPPYSKSNEGSRETEKGTAGVEDGFGSRVDELTKAALSDPARPAHIVALQDYDPDDKGYEHYVMPDEVSLEERKLKIPRARLCMRGQQTLWAPRVGNWCCKTSKKILIPVTRAMTPLSTHIGFPWRRPQEEIVRGAPTIEF